MNKRIKTSLRVILFACVSFSTFSVQSIGRRAVNTAKQCMNSFQLSRIAPHIPLINNRSFSMRTGLGNHPIPVTQKPFNNYQKIQSATQSTRRWKLAAGLALGAGLFQGATAQGEPEETAMSLEQLTENVKSELAKEDAQLMQEFLSLTGIDPNEWEKIKEICKLLVAIEEGDQLAHPKTIPLAHSALRKRVESILRKNDIDPATIVIITQKYATRIAGVLRNVLIINAQEVHGFSQAALEIVLNHEIQHLKNEDVLIHRIIDKYLIKKNTKKAKAFLRRRYHFEERRADILGILAYARSNNINTLDMRIWACNISSNCTKYPVCDCNPGETSNAHGHIFKLRDDYDVDYDSHPSTQQRFTYINQLLKKIPAHDKSSERCNLQLNKNGEVETTKSNWFKRLFGY